MVLRLSEPGGRGSESRATMRDMSLLAISIFVSRADEVSAALDRAADAVASGARLIEWRIDALASEHNAANAAQRLVHESPAPCIITCRPTFEGGMYDGDEDARLLLLEHLIRLPQPPRYVDVELAAFKRRAWKQALTDAVGSSSGHGAGTSLILSSHDFDRRPADLLQRVEQMTIEPACSVIKVAWAARSLRDNLEAFDLLAGRQKPMIALCMGRFGLMSRALASKYGGFLTFAADSPDAATAPGQPTIKTLRERYRFDAINRKTRVYSIIGWPVEQSRSPDIHNAAFSAIGHDGVLLPMPIPPEYEHFKATVASLIDHPHLDFRGAAVTIPHKENLLRFVLERGGRSDELSERIGAANTLIVGSTDAVSCMNTDCPAALEALTHGMHIQPNTLRDKHIVVLGAGGVARSVIAGVAGTGAKVSVINRHREKARKVLDELRPREAASGERIDVIVNCTPIGMAGGPDPDGLPLSIDGDRPIEIDHSMTVFDTVYNPQRTPLLAEAESRGARTVTGTDMFLRQAAMQFHAWTGQAAPMDIFEQSLV